MVLLAAQQNRVCPSFIIRPFMAIAACDAGPKSGRPGAWRKTLTKHSRPDLAKSCWQLANSAVAFFALWGAMYWSLSFSYWLTLLLAIPTAGLLVRLFIIQHDCGHHSFFNSLRANEIVGSRRS